MLAGDRVNTGPRTQSLLAVWCLWSFRWRTENINMIYTQLIKTLQRNLQQVSGQYSRQKCLFVHLRNVPTASKSTLCRQTEVVSSLIPVFSHTIKTLASRSFSLYFIARNKTLPEDKDKSISKYQRGSPKPSTAQKGKTNQLCTAQHENIKSVIICNIHSFTFCIVTWSTDVLQLKKLAETSPTWLLF